MMTNVCSGCGREIEKNFVYCPWCGIQLIKKESREYQNLFFEQVEQKRRTEQEQKLQNVGKQVLPPGDNAAGIHHAFHILPAFGCDELEKELDVLVLCAELAR